MTHTNQTFSNTGSSGSVTFITEGSVVTNMSGTVFGAAPAVWEGVLALEGHPTDDGRYLMPGDIGERELPLTLMAQTVTAEGHMGAEVAGKITEVWREPRPDLGEAAVAVMGRGPFDDSAFGRETARMVENEVLRGVSVDLAVSEVLLLDAETLEVVDPEQLDLTELLMGGGTLTGIKGTIMGATIVPFPAFGEAAVRVVGDKQAVVASAFGQRVRREALTASAAGLAPLHPPQAWFEAPEPDGPCPLTVTDDGRVFGHLALWNQCHVGIPESCQLAPRSQSDYLFFHLGEIKTEEGARVQVGRLTVGERGHAPIGLGRKATVEHYDRSGTVAAFVRASNGVHGVWLCGAVRSDCPAEKVRDLMANPPSGDWRWENGSLELVAALAVPVPGFPVPRLEAALVASGEQEHVQALWATGYVPPTPMTREQLRKMTLLTEKARRAFKDYPAAERRRMARDGRALPDGSFPIKDCGDAEDAIRSVGRAAPAKRERVETHIRKRVRSLGCEGSVFENWD